MELTPTIVHSNELVEASYSLSINEIRLIALASSKCDSRKKNFGDIEISVAEFASVYQLGLNSTYKELKKIVESIMTKPVKLLSPTGEVRVLSWLIESRYTIGVGDDNSKVVIHFSPLIEPYLFELKERFTTINFEYASRLNTPFSFRLYQWLIKVKNLNSAKNYGTVSVILDNHWMKQQAGLIGLYERWDVFRNRVIEPAIEQINSKTDISVIWEPVRKGRSIQSVKFSYVVETGAFAKPIRPRLHRRPNVVKGSHEEGSWMRKNLSLLLSYREELKKYDSRAKLDIKDLERIAEYSSICDRMMHEKALKELADRRKRTVN